jgi:hypothetical protein
MCSTSNLPAYSCWLLQGTYQLQATFCLSRYHYRDQLMGVASPMYAKHVHGLHPSWRAWPMQMPLVAHTHILARKPICCLTINNLSMSALDPYIWWRAWPLSMPPPYSTCSSKPASITTYIEPSSRPIMHKSTHNHPAYGQQHQVLNTHNSTFMCHTLTSWWAWAHEIAWVPCSACYPQHVEVPLQRTLACPSLHPYPCNVAWHTYCPPTCLSPYPASVMLELSLSVEPTHISHLRTKSSPRRHMLEPLLVLSWAPTQNVLLHAFLMQVDIVPRSTHWLQCHLQPLLDTLSYPWHASLIPMTL